VILYGLHLSKVGPIPGDGVQEGNSLLYALLKVVSKGEWLPSGHRDVALHPTAWAGWAGLLVTMINCCPWDSSTAVTLRPPTSATVTNVSPVWCIAPCRDGAGHVRWVMHLVRAESGERWDRRLAMAIAGQRGAVLAGVVRAAVDPGRFSGARIDHPPVEDRALPPVGRRYSGWWWWYSSRSSCRFPSASPSERRVAPWSAAIPALDPTARRCSPPAKPRGRRRPARQAREVLCVGRLLAAAALRYRAT